MLTLLLNVDIAATGATMVDLSDACNLFVTTNKCRRLFHRQRGKVAWAATLMNPF